MKKLEFIKELRSRLKGYPKDVVDNAVNYYSECIDDAVEDGRNEEEAVRALGSMDEIVREGSGKRYTAARMRRMLYGAALGLCAEDTKTAPSYIRVLAASEKGRAQLASLRGKTPLPVLNKSGEIKRAGLQAQKVFRLGAEAHELYRLVCPSAGRCEPGEDWRKSTVIV